MSHPVIETTVHESAGAVLRYRLKSTEQSSERLGACEVCNQHASEVFHLTGARLYDRAGERGTGPVGFGWTHDNCICVFGHADCLKSRRIGAPVMTLTDDRNDAGFRAVINGIDVCIGRDSEGFKVYIADRYEGLFSTLVRAYRFAESAALHPERRRPITCIPDDFIARLA
jgi:hypothetical protein